MCTADFLERNIIQPRLQPVLDANAQLKRSLDDLSLRLKEFAGRCEERMDRLTASDTVRDGQIVELLAQITGASQSVKQLSQDAEVSKAQLSNVSKMIKEHRNDAVQGHIQMRKFIDENILVSLRKLESASGINASA